jgi:hypothetical protein
MFPFPAQNLANLSELFKSWRPRAIASVRPREAQRAEVRAGLAIILTNYRRQPVRAREFRLASQTILPACPRAKLGEPEWLERAEIIRAPGPLSACARERKAR